MAYYVELSGGKIAPAVKLSGGGIVPGARLSGGSIYATGSGGGGPVNLQSKSVSYTPTESAQTDQVTADQGYDGLSEVDVSVGAISSSYVGSAVPRKSSSDLTESGATVTAPSGYYENSASKAIANASTPYVSWASINNDGTVSYDIDVNSAGYIADDTFSGTTGNPQVTVQGAQTIYPSTSDQTIASGKYLTGAQTILGDADLVAGNIKKDVNIFGVVGTYEGGGADDVLVKLMKKTLTKFECSVSGTINHAGNFLSRQTSLTEVSLPNLTQIGTSSSNVGDNFCRYDSNLTKVYMPKMQKLYGARIFGSCTALVSIALPSLVYGYGQYHFDGCNHLERVDYGKANETPSNGLEQNMFYGCSALNMLVLRYSSVRTLGNINTFNNSRFASTGSGGVLYVPASLVSSYQSASNWSTILGYANNQIKSIESTHTDPDAPIDLTLYYADGTPIS